MAFVLTARIRVVPPPMAPVVAKIRSSLRGITATIDLRIKPASLKAVASAAASLRATASASATASAGVTKLGEQIALAAKRFVAFSLATAGIVRFFGALRSGISDAVAFERELVKIAQVTNTSIKNLSGLTAEITRLSTSFGVSSMKLLQASRILAQTGLSADQVKISLEALAKSDLAPTFEDIVKTAEGSIAIFRQFKKDAEELESILGSINSVSSKFAVESGDIITAIRRTGGAFAATGGTIEDLIALFTSVRATTRESAESIATGFRTIFTRLQRIRTQTFLENLGINLRDAEGQFIGPLRAIGRLSAALKNLRGTDPKFAQIIEELGGFRQVSKVIPLVQQFETAQSALSVAQTGQISLTRDAIKAQGALAVQIQKTKEEFAAMIRKFTDNSSFKAVVQFALKLAKAFVKIGEALEKITPLLLMLGGVALGRSLGPLLSGFKSRGGLGFASGGIVPGKGNRDTVPAMLTPGEFVIKKDAVKAIGPDKLSKMNEGGKVRTKNLRKTASTGVITLNKNISATPYWQSEDWLSVDYDPILVDPHHPKVSERLRKAYDNADSVNKQGFIFEDIVAAVHGIKHNKRSDFLDFTNGEAKSDVRFNSNLTSARYNDILVKSLNQRFGSIRKLFTPNVDDVKAQKRPIKLYLDAMKQKVQEFATGSSGRVKPYGYMPGFKPIILGRGSAEMGDVGAKKQILMQQIAFLQAKQEAGTITDDELILLKRLLNKQGGIRYRRSISFAKKMMLGRFAGGGLVTNKFGGAFLSPMDVVKPGEMKLDPKKIESDRGFAKDFYDKGLVNKDTNVMNVDLLYSSLKKGIQDNFESDINVKVRDIVKDKTGKIASKMGFQPPKEIKGIPNIEGIVGGIFEGVIGSVSDITDFSDSKKHMDFPSGLKPNAARLFGGNLLGRVVDAKRSLNKNNVKDLKNQVRLYIRDINNELLGDSVVEDASAKLSEDNKRDVSRLNSYLLTGKGGKPATAINNLKAAGIITPGSGDLSKAKLANMLRSKGLLNPGIKFASGGSVDTVPALLTPGEFVVNKDAVNRIGVSNLKNMNNAKGYAKGGVVEKAGGGMIGSLGTVGFGFAGLSAVIGQFEGVSKKLQGTLQDVTSIGAQFAVLNSILSSVNNGFGGFDSKVEKFSNELAEATAKKEAADEREDALSKKGDKLERKRNALIAKGVAVPGKLNREIAKTRADELVAMADAADASDDIVQSKRDLQTLKVLGKVSQVSSQGITALTAGLVTYGSKISDSGRKKLEEGGTDTEEFVRGETYKTIGTGITAGAVAGGAVGGKIGALAEKLGIPFGGVVGQIAGNLIGGIAGGIIGSTIGKKMAEEEARRIKSIVEFRKSAESLGRRFEGVAAGTTTFKEQRAFIKSFVDTSERKLRTTDKEEDRTEILDTSVKYLENYNQYLRESAKNVAESGGTFKEFIDLAGDSVVSFVAELRGVPVPELRKEIETLIKDEKERIKISKEFTASIDDYNRQTKVLNSISRALNDAEFAVRGFGTAVDAIVSASTVYTTKIQNFSDRLSKPQEFFNSDSFDMLVTDLFARNPILTKMYTGGDKNLGVRLAEEASVANRIITELPRVLLNVRSVDPTLEEGTMVDEIIDSFGDIPDFVKSSLRASSAKIIGSEGKEEILVERIKNDFYGVLSEYSSSMSPIFEAISAINSKMVEEVNRQFDILAKQTQLEQKRVELLNKNIDLFANYEKTLASTFDRKVNIGLLEKLDTEKLGNILGPDRRLGNNVSAISSALNSAIFNIDRSTRELETRGAPDAGFIRYIEDQKRQAERLTNALEFLADVDNRLIGVQEKIAREQAESKVKYDILSEFASAGSFKDIRNQFRVLGSAKTAALTGNIRSVFPSLRKEVISFLQAIGKATSPGLRDARGNALTGEQVLTKLFYNIGREIGLNKKDAFYVARQNVSEKTPSLVSELQTIFMRAEEANNTLRGVIESKQDKLDGILTNSFDNFLIELRKISASIEKSFLETDKATKEARLAEISTTTTPYGDIVRGFFGGRESDAEKVRRSLELFKDLGSKIKIKRDIGAFGAESRTGSEDVLDMFYGPVVRSGAAGAVPYRRPDTVLSRALSGSFFETKMKETSRGRGGGTLFAEREYDYLVKLVEKELSKTVGGNESVLAVFRELTKQQIRGKVHTKLAGEVGEGQTYIRSEDIINALTESVSQTRAKAQGMYGSIDEDLRNLMEQTGWNDLGTDRGQAYILRVANSYEMLSEAFKNIENEKTIPNLVKETTELTSSLEELKVKMEALNVTIATPPVKPVPGVTAAAPTPPRVAPKPLIRIPDPPKPRGVLVSTREAMENPFYDPRRLGRDLTTYEKTSNRLRALERARRARIYKPKPKPPVDTEGLFPVPIAGGSSDPYYMGGMFNIEENRVRKTGSGSSDLNSFESFRIAVVTCGQKIDGLTQAINSLNGLNIEISGRHDVNVNINGLAVLKQLEPGIQNLVVSEVNKGINKILKQHFPNIIRN